MDLVEAPGRAAEIQLDDLGGARADKEQQADVWPAREQSGDNPVQLLVGIGQACEIALLHDGGGEAGFCEDHHAGGRLDQVRAGA